MPRKLSAILLVVFAQTGAAGVADTYRGPTNGPAAFSSACAWSHSANDDPILRHGHSGHSHLHDFFGNRSTNAHSTAARLRRGRTNCSIGADRSAYWAPSLLKRDRIVRPTRVVARYVNDGAGRRIRPLPKGLKMIAGDMHAAELQSRKVVKWSCRGARRDHRAIPRCAKRGVRLRIKFPSCWDGRRTDSRDHERHMSYRRGDWDHGWHCPRSHPVPVPTLTLDLTYPIRNGRRVYLASGHVRTAHADFFNGWRQSALVRMTRRCLANRRGCSGRWSRRPTTPQR